jgi:hypothetical protein
MKKHTAIHWSEGRTSGNTVLVSPYSQFNVDEEHQEVPTEADNTDLPQPQKGRGATRPSLFTARQLIHPQPQERQRRML